MTENVLALERQVCFAPAFASRTVNAVYRPLLEPLGLTHPQYLVMLALWDTEPRTVRSLSETLALDPGTLSPLVKRLAAAGYLTRTRDPDDERALRIALTPAGKALRSRAEKVPPAVVARLGMTLAELQDLRAGLDQVIDAAQRRAQHVRGVVPARIDTVPISRVTTTDYHTAGEPFRIVAEPPVALPGDTVADRRARAIADPEAQALRELLCFEPRGHADMYGGFLVPPDDDGADLGVLFWHKDGFSTACGHGTIALGAWAVATGLVAAPDDGSVDVAVDVPSGRVTARVHRAAGRTVAVDFVNVASHVIARDVPLTTTRGDLLVTLAYGGAIYACVDATAAGLHVDPEHHQDLIALGREVKWALDASEHAQHPTDPRLSGVYGTILWEEPAPGPAGADVHQRNVTVFADGEVDRSPCGSGTCARLAVLAADGRVAPGGPVLHHTSIVGSVFTGAVVGTTTVDGRAAVLPQVTGTAHLTGEHTFVVDPDDVLVPGFVLR